MIALLLALAQVSIFEPAAGVGGGWRDLGWSPRTLERGAPATVDFSHYGGWVLYHPPAPPSHDTLRVRVKLPIGFEGAIIVRFETATQKLPAFELGANGTPAPDGFTDYAVPMSKLDPALVPVEKLVFWAQRDVPPMRVQFAGIWLEGAAPRAADPYVDFAGPSRPVRLAADCSAPSRAISPLIYGVGFGIPGAEREKHLEELNVTARRWGGNPTSRYNWQLGNAWNTASDWFFQNTDYHVPAGYSWRTYLEQNRSFGLATALTVPTIGWVAKDTRTPSFPVSVFGPQHAVAPENHDAGDGKKPSGEALPSPRPEANSVAMPPAAIEAWVKAIRESSKDRRAVDIYILDNEPGLWSSTHRDVHPEPVTYDELLEKTLTYGAAVRRADPQAMIAGPAEWGWPQYFYSALDMTSRFRPDRLRHGNKPLLPWLLGKIREHEKQTGTKILDLLDVHFYPQFKGAGVGLQGDTSPEAAARRLRSTRSLWDPRYRDESWIDDSIQLLPRLRGWIDDNAPGVGISIGEWNFGAEGHMSGGLAVAEVLGRFGQYGVTSAFYWTDPAPQTPAFEAFRAYRNYDGAGAHFLEQSIAATSTDPLVSVFASRSADARHMVLVVLNLDPAQGADTQLFMPACGAVKSVRAFGLAENMTALKPLAKAPAAPLTQKLPPYSITVLELQTGAP